MAAIDSYEKFTDNMNSPAEHAAAITTHDTNELTYVTRAIWVGVGGNIKVTLVSGDVVTFTGVPTGTLLPVRAKIVWATGTTATTMLAVW